MSDPTGVTCKAKCGTCLMTIVHKIIVGREEVKEGHKTVLVVKRRLQPHARKHFISSHKISVMILGIEKAKDQPIDDKGPR